MGYNAVLCNLYRNGNDCVGPHADAEPEKGAGDRFGRLGSFPRGSLSAKATAPFAGKREMAGDGVRRSDSCLTHRLLPEWHLLN
jgi:hypothetical protein